ncbi:toll-like receptor Tollo [Chironomus tepperi]|uniref:toll-like receptor Tollo n=1 Tax=Chironomus tepperi TaxID=113505 RepID=UPI00391FC085
MDFRILIIICALIVHKCEAIAESMTCSYSDKAFNILYKEDIKYTCEFTIDDVVSYEIELENGINGYHDKAKADDNVTVLEIMSNLEQFTSIFCNKFQNLEVISIDNVTISSFDEYSLQLCVNLVILDLNAVGITEIPANLFSENLNLNEIRIMSNNIEELPQDVFESQENLMNLSLINNKIQFLPSRVFGSLKNLEFLNLDNNLIKVLDPELFKSQKKLQKLSLNSNKITELPKDVFINLNDLMTLEISSNQLTVINSNSFGKHSSLSYVNFNDNRIFAMDSEFFKLGIISTLKMEGNVCINETIYYRQDENLQTCYDNFRNDPSNTTPEPSTTTTTITAAPDTSTIIPTPDESTSTASTTTTSPTPTTLVPKPEEINIALSPYSADAYPWVAAVVLMNSDYQCGGVLVSDTKIVTAASCMYSKTKGKKLFSRDIQIVLGSRSIFRRFEKTKSTLPVNRISIHPDYKVDSPLSNIAVIILDRKVLIKSHINSTEISDNDSAITDAVYVAHGTNKTLSTKDTAVKAGYLQTSILNNENCQNSKIDELFCISQDSLVPTCVDVIGSGLYVKQNSQFYLRGILTSVSGSCRSLFTDVSKYKDWIDNAAAVESEEFKFLLIFCGLICEIAANDAVCKYARSDIFVYFIRNQGYKCELKFDTDSYEDVSSITGDHVQNNADGNVNILLSYQSSKISDFTSIFCEKFPNLEAIKLDNVKIKSIDDDSLQNCQHLRLLHLNNNKISLIPKNLLTENAELSEIEIGSNKLRTLDTDTFEMQNNLKKLFLNKNKIETLPSRIFQPLRNLERLNLDGNAIEILDPKWFEPLEKLEKLSLNSNKINDLPEGIFSSLEQLRLLEVTNNRLSAIYADSFGSHRHLTNVHLSFNQIDAIDPDFVDISPMSVLLLEHNVCFNENVTRRDLFEDDLETCFNNFKDGRARPHTSLTTSTTTTTTTTTTTKRPTTTTTTTRKPTTTTTTTTTKKPTTTTTTTEPTTTKRPTTRRPRPTTTEMTTKRPKPTAPIFILPTAKYGTPHPSIKPPNPSSSQFDRGAYPWIVAVHLHDKYHCGGVLISNKKVVTAARCVYNKLARDLMVILGSHTFKKFETGKATTSVYRIRLNPEFDIDAGNVDADVAVLILNDEVKFTMYVRPIAMMDINPDSVTVNDGMVVSYGRIGAGSTVNPRQIQTQIHDSQDCSISSNEASDRTFCGQSDVCTEDVGSGLFIKYDNHYYLRGIVSSVIGVNNDVCDDNSKDIFTDIYKFTEWIANTPIEDVIVDYD